MFTGPRLGKALRAAMEAKEVTQQQVAEEFGIKQPSVSEWLKHGRIGKQHITHLVAYFADKVPPSHWGLPEHWSATHVAEPAPPPYVPRALGEHTDTPLELTDTEWSLLTAFKDLPEAKRQDLLNQALASAAEFRALADEILKRYSPNGLASAERVSSALPPAPKHPPRRTPDRAPAAPSAPVTTRKRK